MEHSRLLNRGQIALILLNHIFEMDNDNLQQAFHDATGDDLAYADSRVEIGEVWSCEQDMSRYFNTDQHRILDYLRSLIPSA